MAIERIVEKLKDKGIIQTERIDDIWPFECLNGCGGSAEGYIVISRVAGVVVSKSELRVGEIYYFPENEQSVKECDHKWVSMPFI